MTRDPHHDEQMSELTTAKTATRTRTWTWTLAQKNRSRQKAAFLRALRATGEIMQACQLAGIGHTTLRRWRRDYPAFEKQFQLERAQLVSEVEDSLRTIALDPKNKGAVKAAEILLKAHDRERYGDQVTLNQQVTVNHNVQVVHSVKALQQEKLRQLEAARTIDLQPHEPTEETTR